MSIGPPALGNVLVQRLDAVLGTTMAAQANLVSGARSDAITQAGESARLQESDSATRNPRQMVDGIEQGRERQARSVDTRTAAALALAARGLVTRADTTPSAPTTLGSTARIILALLAQYPETAPPVLGRTPLLSPNASDVQTKEKTASPSATVAASVLVAKPEKSSINEAPALNPQTNVRDTNLSSLTTMLTQALRRAIEQSGLFYESHLSDLTFGKRTPQQLNAEPQAHLTMPKTSSDARLADPKPTPMQSAVPTNGSTVSTLGTATSAETPPPSPGTPVPGVHPDTNTVVRQQLEILANQVIYWRGEAWPGMSMDWEIRREPHSATPDDPDSHWATRLNLDLPRLGTIEARLSLNNSELVLQLISPHSAIELDNSIDLLRQHLTTAGITLSQCAVHAMPPVFQALQPEDSR